MNISEIKKLTTCDGWVDFTATITEIKEIKERKKSNLSKNPGQVYYTQKLRCCDATDSIGVHAYKAQGQVFPVGQPMLVHGQLKEYQGTRYIDYADVKINVNASVPPQGAKSPPTPSDTPPPVDWDAKDLRIAKMCALNNAVAKQTMMAEIDKNLSRVDSYTIIKTAEEMLNWIYAGPETELEKEASDLLGEGADELPPDDGIPY